MPIDESHLFRGLVDYVANRSVVGTVLMHPIWFSIVVVAIIVLTLVIIGWEGTPTFKLMFYLLAGVGCAVLTHDALIEQHQIDQNDTAAMTEIVDDIHDRATGGQIEPRSLDDMPDDFMVHTGSASRYIQPLVLTAEELEHRIDHD